MPKNRKIARIIEHVQVLKRVLIELPFFAARRHVGDKARNSPSYATAPGEYSARPQQRTLLFQIRLKTLTWRLDDRQT